MLNKELKQTAVLLSFCALLSEVLTFVTLGLAIVGSLFVVLNYRVNTIARNIISLGVFGSYWLTYGKIIDPEVGLNFLTSIIVLKILERETIRDRYMIFFGLILLISAGSLFEKTLTYLLFFTFSFWILIKDFYSFLEKEWRIKDFILSFFWVFPLTFLLFLLVPRLLSPIPFDQNTMGPGEVGYTSDVIISEIESLSSNNNPAFDVTVSKIPEQDELYWRGNTLSYNDGWNWKEMIQDKEDPVKISEEEPKDHEIKQKFRLYSRSAYFFSLNYPDVISYKNEFYRLNKAMKTLPQRRWDWVQRYEVMSDPHFLLKDDPADMAHYLKVPISKKQKEKIKKMFSGNATQDVSESIKNYFIKNNFSYSLSPGKVESLDNFFEKKTGLCSHYASATAIVLRLKGIPTRLVSGFMGGNYNKYANFYHVTQNDAHVWVEAFDQGVWKKIDPTTWVAPERILLGGDAFMASINPGRFNKNSFTLFPSLFQELKLWFKQWDFKFYQWLEEIDYNTQQSWFDRFSFKREWVLTFIPFLMVIFMLSYMAWLSLKTSLRPSGVHQELWKLFYKKMKKKGVILSPISLKTSYEILKNENGPEFIKVWEDLMAYSFEGREMSPKEIKKRIKKL